MKSLQELKEDYWKAANALTKYGHKNGFKPGARVRAQYNKEPSRNGVIARYGEAWLTCSHDCVPVILDSGKLQPWCMLDLTILSACDLTKK